MSKQPRKIDVTLPVKLGVIIGGYCLVRFALDFLSLGLWVLAPFAIGLVVVAACGLSEQAEGKHPSAPHPWQCQDTLCLSLSLLGVFALALWLPIFLTILLLFTIGLHYRHY